MQQTPPGNNDILEREAGPEEGCIWFEPTGFNLCNQFADYWQQNGLRDPQLNSFQRSLALFGQPLTRLYAAGGEDGPLVWFQIFERARFELRQDPNNPDRQIVLLGLLGSELRLGAPQAIVGPASAAYVADNKLNLASVHSGAADVREIGGAISSAPVWSSNGAFLLYADNRNTVRLSTIAQPPETLIEAQNAGQNGFDVNDCNYTICASINPTITSSKIAVASAAYCTWLVFWGRTGGRPIRVCKSNPR